jgi:mRNA-degrading endonuclease RelE of RelBE toxin-antitoxin system
VNINLHPRFRKRVAKLNATERTQIADALRALQEGFGFPHLHSGLGIRRLRKSLFECRAGLHWRIVFFAEKGLLTAYDVMTHEQVKAWLRSF